MKLRIPYEGDYLKVELPLPKKNIRVFESKDPSPTTDVETLVRNALEEPIGRKKLSEIVHPGQRVAVLFDDWTRPTPISKIMPIVLEELKKGGVRENDIFLVSSNGMHDPKYMTEERMIQKLGKEIYRRYQVISHDAYDYKKLGSSAKFMGDRWLG